MPRVSGRAVVARSSSRRRRSGVAAVSRALEHSASRLRTVSAPRFRCAREAQQCHVRSAPSRRTRSSVGGSRVRRCARATGPNVKSGVPQAGSRCRVVDPRIDRPCRTLDGGDAEAPGGRAKQHWARSQRRPALGRMTLAKEYWRVGSTTPAGFGHSKKNTSEAPASQLLREPSAQHCAPSLSSRALSIAEQFTHQKRAARRRTSRDLNQPHPPMATRAARAITNHTAPPRPRHGSRATNTQGDDRARRDAGRTPRRRRAAGVVLPGPRAQARPRDGRLRAQARRRRVHGLRRVLPRRRGLG